MKYYFAAILALALTAFTPLAQVHASETVSQYVTLESGWNIVSTPRLLESHAFSAEETSENFDIFVLDASTPSGWATMADLGQTEFTPLFGYFINNKTGAKQTLTFNYDNSVAPNDKLFERTFSEEGWYSIGVANPTYAKPQGADTTDTNNPSKLLSLLEGKYDLVIDFTDIVYNSVRKSVSLSDPWKAVVPVDIDNLNDFRETKGYAVYVKEAGAKYIGFQNDVVPSTDTLVIKPSSNSPDGTILQLKNDDTSDWLPVFIFDLDTESSIGDVAVDSIEVTINLSSSTYEDIVFNSRLYVDGRSESNKVVVNPDSSNTVVAFEFDPPIIISNGDQANAQLELKFKPLIPGNEGTTVFAEVTPANASAISAESFSQITATGAAVGGTHILRTGGVDISLENTSAEVTNVDGDDNDYATFEIEVEITAVAQDVFISTDPATSISYVLQDSTGVASIEGSRAVVLTSTADEVGTYFEINEGSTETISLTVTYTPAQTVAARMVLNSVSFAPISIPPTQTQVTLPVTTYRTSVVTIVN